jgi:hypothetical protein
LHDYEQILVCAVPEERWATFGPNEFADYVRHWVALPSHYGKDSAAVQDAIIEHFSRTTMKPYGVEWDGEAGFWLKKAIDVSVFLSLYTPGSGVVISVFGYIRIIKRRIRR